jgi:predicted nucleic acid-binding Zn ribbon protein
MGTVTVEGVVRCSGCGFAYCSDLAEDQRLHQAFHKRCRAKRRCCLACGASIASRHISARTCSPACKDKLERERRAKRLGRPIPKHSRRAVAAMSDSSNYPPEPAETTPACIEQYRHRTRLSHYVAPFSQLPPGPNRAVAPANRCPPAASTIVLPSAPPIRPSPAATETGRAPAAWQTGQALPVPPQHLEQIAKPRVIQHTDRNLSWWRTPGIRFAVSAFACTAGMDVPGVRFSTSKSVRVCPARSRNGCATARPARRSRWVAPRSQSPA